MTDREAQATPTLMERLEADAAEWDSATIDGAAETRALLREAATELSRIQSLHTGLMAEADRRVEEAESLCRKAGVDLLEMEGRNIKANDRLAALEAALRQPTEEMIAASYEMERAVFGPTARGLNHSAIYKAMTAVALSALPDAGKGKK